jgi:hypothetical protein
MKACLRSAVCALVLGMATTASAQLLDIEINNGVFYVYDTADRSGFAASPAVVPPWSGGPSPLNFFKGMFIADIVSVNGQPARGVMVRRGTRVGLTTNQMPGQANADTRSACPLSHQGTDTVILFKAVDSADVRVIQCRQHTRFALEAREALSVRREDPR